MSIRHCKKCNRSFSDSTLCPICLEQLVYFGREESVLSPSDILAEYDSKHPYNPIADYTGEYYINTFHPAQEAMMMECEDTLKRHPEDLDASFHLALCYMTKGNMEQAQRYIEPVIAAGPADVGPYKKAVSVYMALNNPEKAYGVLLVLSQREPESLSVWENLGKVCVSLSKTKRAYAAFKEAEKLCRDENKKDSLGQMMLKLQVYMGSDPK